MKLENYDIHSLARALEKGELSSVELTKLYLSRIEELDRKIGAYITVCADSALKLAADSDERRKRGESLSSLDGIPFSVKDNFCVEAFPTTCGSKFLKNYIPPYTATAVQKLLLSGGVLLGKTNMDEFGMGSLCDSSYFGKTANPLDLSHSPGGSSGGSAASVAADLAAFSVGSDTGGSVRLPAAFCGTVGLKPTYGRISRYGLVAFASSLDTVGFLTKSVRDNALLLSVMSGKDERDATSISAPAFDKSTVTPTLKGVRFGVVKELCHGASESVKTAFNATVRRLMEMGAAVTEISLPSASLAAESYYIISSCEAASNLARFDGVRYGSRAENCRNIEELYVKSRSEGFGDEVKRRIMLGNFALSEGYYEEYYGRAQALRSALSKEVANILEDCDILLSPTSFVTAPRHDSAVSRSELYAGDICTVVANLCGIPAISVPYGTGENDMPVGIQLMAGRLCESRLLSAAMAMNGEK